MKFKVVATDYGSLDKYDLPRETEIETEEKSQRWMKWLPEDVKVSSKVEVDSLEELLDLYNTVEKVPGCLDGLLIQKDGDEWVIEIYNGYRE